MGSLVGGWDSRAPGTVPKGFEDYKEPYAPRGPRRTVGPATSGEPAAMSGGLDKAGGGPPPLARTSAPAMHGASALQRYLSRASGGQGSMPVPSMPREPGSPRTGSPRPGSPRGLCKTLSLKLGDDDPQESPLNAKERWCSRVESASLNLRPDVEDQEEWRHGSFMLADPCHSLQYPASPTQQEGMVATHPTGAAEQVAQPATPASRPQVTVSRLT